MKNKEPTPHGILPTRYGNQVSKEVAFYRNKFINKRFVTDRHAINTEGRKIHQSRNPDQNFPKKINPNSFSVEPVEIRYVNVEFTQFLSITN